jgi:hypothetical protein
VTDRGVSRRFTLIIRQCEALDALTALGEWWFSPGIADILAGREVVSAGVNATTGSNT